MANEEIEKPIEMQPRGHLGMEMIAREKWELTRTRTDFIKQTLKLVETRAKRLASRRQLPILHPRTYLPILAVSVVIAGVAGYSFKPVSQTETTDPRQKYSELVNQHDEMNCIVNQAEYIVNQSCVQRKNILYAQIHGGLEEFVNSLPTATIPPTLIAPYHNMPVSYTRTPMVTPSPTPLETPGLGVES